jgi:hypothetical protein
MTATFGNQRQFHGYGMNRYEMEFRGVFRERIVISARHIQATVRRGLAGFQRPGRATGERRTAVANNPHVGLGYIRLLPCFRQPRLRSGPGCSGHGPRWTGEDGRDA